MKLNEKLRAIEYVPLQSQECHSTIRFILLRFHIFNKSRPFYSQTVARDVPGENSIDGINVQAPHSTFSKAISKN